ncbi:sensor histidine kinase [Paenibacillus hamazuiensis]|uniref:sensor histidine kinase n=1 Tax=Paenibacillus hamazuiensis TaxID=2936508 RepID=UPI00200EE533|nr:HAMP domain-containing sensor histidine kinase [Paenibacillus hamazuiensis]
MKYSIQFKILMYVSVIVFAGFSVLTYAAFHTTEQNTEGVVKADMIEIKKNLDIYLSQYLLFNNMEANEASILSEAEHISKQLTAQVGSAVDIYDMKGQKLSYGLAPYAGLGQSEDLSKATEGEVSYTTNFTGNQVIVSLSYPIKEAGIGIVRYYKDYTELFDYNQRFKRMISLFATVIFAVIFVTSYFFSKQITKPIMKLTEASEEVAEGNFNVDVDIASTDEIGHLSSRFKMMVRKIREQIDIIKQDRDKLEEVQKENKSFFDNVTHELKTPLTTITGYAQAISDLGIKDDEFTRKGLACIINESNRLNNMVIELIELSKASSKKFGYEFADVDLSGLIKETCEEMMIKGKKYNIAIESHAEDKLYMQGDKDRLKEVLINLIDNSIKYGNVNSIVHVHAYRQHNVIFIKVQDQGTGIPEELIEKVFDPFYRVSPKASRELGSSGLGLAIVKEIVERHKGHIEIISKWNEGTEVVLRFGSGDL